MINVHSIGLNKIVTFDKVALKIEKAPLTFVYGRNYDADDEEGVTGNGTGKSVLFSSIANLRYQAPPTAHKKKSKKDMLSRKGAKIRLLLSANKTKSILTQSASGYSITEDGVDQQFKRIADAEDRVAELIPLTPVEYYTTAFLATNRKFSMQAATDSDRLLWFTEIFRFDFFDHLQKHFSKKARLVKDDEIRMQVLEAARLSLKAKIKKAKESTQHVDLTALEKEKRKLDGKIQEINDRLFELNRLQPDAETLVQTYERIDKLQSKHNLSGDQSERVAKLKAQRKALRSWDDYDSEHRSWSKASATYQERVEALQQKARVKRFKKEILKELKSELKESEAALERIEREFKEAQRDHDRYLELKADQKRIAKKLLPEEVTDSKDGIEASLAQARVTAKLRRLLDQDHDHEDGECPTCLSKIDLSSIRRAVKTAEKAIPTLEEKLEALEAQALLKTIKKKIKDLNFDEGRIEGLDSDRSQTRASVKGLEQRIEALDDLEQLIAKGAPEEPEAPSMKRPKRSLDEINDELEVISKLGSLQESIEATLKKSDFSAFSDKPIDSHASAKAIAKVLNLESEELTGKQRKRQSKLSDVSSTLSDLSAKQAELDLYIRERKDTVGEMEKLAPSLANKKVVDGLLKFYSSKSQRAKAANTVCTLLESNLNQYRDLIFAEPFKFTVEATDTGISMMVDRGNGPPTDVRFLSAAEADCFNCLHLLSILPLIPSSRRLNMVVLDEPCAHAHQVTRRVFRDRYLPVLCSVVPHVFVITQNDDDYIDGARKLLVIKENGVSRLEEVEPTN